jgi:hypothetical protein
MQALQDGTLPIMGSVLRIPANVNADSNPS